MTFHPELIVLAEEFNMKKYIWLFCLTLVLMTCGCSKSKEQEGKVNSNTEQKITIEQLDKRLRELELTDIYKDFDKIAFITLSEKKFQTINSSIGAIAFLVEDVKPYANGASIKILIGNPINATLSDVKFKIDFGQLDEKNIPIADNERTKDVILINSLKKGSWNKEEIILGGIQPENLGYIRIHDFSFGAMSLNN